MRAHLGESAVLGREFTKDADQVQTWPPRPRRRPHLNSGGDITGWVVPSYRICDVDGCIGFTEIVCQ